MRFGFCTSPRLRLVGACHMGVILVHRPKYRDALGTNTVSWSATEINWKLWPDPGGRLPKFDTCRYCLVKRQFIASIS